MTNDELAAIVAIAKGRKLGVMQLLEQSRYRELRSQLSVALLQRYLKEHPEHLKEWELYSADKRSDGWYLDRWGPLWEVGEIKYEVGKLTARRRDFFLSRSRACATFIPRELDDVAAFL